MAAIKEGDVFTKGQTRLIVNQLTEDQGDLFAEVLKFDNKGFVGHDCISHLALFKMRFVTNIMDVK